MIDFLLEFFFLILDSLRLLRAEPSLSVSHDLVKEDDNVLL